LGKISGFGWALGYVGGMVSAVFVLLVLGEVSLENFDRIRWVGPFAAAFFLLAALPTFIWVREPRATPALAATRGYLHAGVDRVRTTLTHLEDHRDLAVLLLSVFFAMSGVAIIITFSFIYGAQVIGWDSDVRTLMFVIVQIMAAVGALGFGALADRIGAVRTYRITLMLWMVTIGLIWGTPLLVDALARFAGIHWQAQHVFLVVGCVSGLSLGSSQSAARTLVGLFSPLSRTSEFFGFWGLSVRLAGVFGLLAIGLLQAILGLHTAMLFCVLLFAVAWGIAARIDETRGRRSAEAFNSSPVSPVN
ncbi:MAG: MFS transporter, partial [Nitriliruptoraceae bacterium]|nr:MFS transporter [Nitriliruptoraceae bacterium]